VWGFVARLNGALKFVREYGLTRVLAGILYQVSATDPLTFAAVAAILGR
jgi:hypothetical protein